MPTKKIKINRAPVLTLWAAVVAERAGYDPDSALTLGKAVAGLNAQSKGRRLGIFEKPTEEKQAAAPRSKKSGEPFMVEVLGRPVPAVRTRAGIRATIKDEPIEPDGVKRYLRQKFGEDLADVRAAMEALAKAYPPETLAKKAYTLYESFRPAIPEGTKGWGAAGALDLNQIRSLAKK
jgi:hypothetical protein